MKRIGSMSWFRLEKQEEFIENFVEDVNDAIDELGENITSISNKVMELSDKIDDVLFGGNKPYKKLKFVGDSLTVVFNDGSIFTKSNATQEDFRKVRECYSETEILNLISVKEEVKDNAVAPTPTEIKSVIDNENFITMGNSIYLKEIPNRSIPPLLVKKFKEVLNNPEEFDALKKFWMKCCLCPNAQSAEDLYEFLSTHNMKIDRHGNFYAYRRVVSLNSDVDKNLVDFISNAYNKVKAVWKKKADAYEVYEENGEYKITDKWVSPEDGHLGNLKELYLELPNMTANRYTDWHSGKMDYRIGEIASIPRQDCNDDNSVSCSKGLHIMSRHYDTLCGDTPALAIINPVDVVAVPKDCNAKLRVSRWFFAMTLSEEERFILDEDGFDVQDLGDVFEEKCMSDLSTHIYQNIVEEAKRHTFTIPSISSKDVDSIVKVLNVMHEQIKHRVKNI